MILDGTYFTIVPNNIDLAVFNLSPRVRKILSRTFGIVLLLLGISLLMVLLYFL